MLRPSRNGRMGPQTVKRDDKNWICIGTGSDDVDHVRSSCTGGRCLCAGPIRQGRGLAGRDPTGIPFHGGLRRGRRGRPCRHELRFQPEPERLDPPRQWRRHVQDPANYELPPDQFQIPTAITASDLNGDDAPDVAVANTGNRSEVVVFLNDGDGTFRDATVYPVGTSPQLAVAHDLDGDGRADLATANQGASNVSVLLGNGDGTFQAPEPYAAVSGTAFVAASDLNGDKKPDLATANASSNDVSTLLNVAPPQVSSVDPASGFQGNTVTLTVDGVAFGSGAKVRLNQGNLSLGASSVTRDSATRLTAEITIPNFVPAGDYDVEVNNPDRSDGVLPQAFQVLAPLSTRISLDASPRQLERGNFTRLFGRITTSGGQPLSGEEVVLEQRPAGTGHRFRELATLSTGPDGGFRLFGIEPSRDTLYRARFEGTARRDSSLPEISSGSR
jgi:hypothetical protein